MTVSADHWRAEAARLRGEQRMGEAASALAQAQALAPDDRLLAMLDAQLAYERGFPAADRFARVIALWPDNRDAWRNRALALASEDEVAAAVALLSDRLDQWPDWLDGHRVLAALRWTSGDNQGFDASFAAATARHPTLAGLWLGWFSTLAQHRDWPRATAVLDAAERHLPPSLGLVSARIFVAGESGDLDTCAALLDQVGARADLFCHLARIRLCLRRGDAAGALAVALPLTTGPVAGQVWPYVSTAWRLLGDPRAGWLDGDPRLAASLRVDLDARELVDLAVLLRQLHTAELAYADQSVRQGTQTDRSVLLRHEPLLERTRAVLLDAVHSFVATLPPHDPAHPLLSRPRAALRVAGSWSVRLRAGGWHVVHSHPMGWLSSAFYVTVPAPADRGPAPAGWLELGAPPPELGLDLPPLRRIEPEPGLLALFPSTMWHGTQPFTHGERMTIAFDIVPA